MDARSRPSKLSVRGDRFRGRVMVPAAGSGCGEFWSYGVGAGRLNASRLLSSHRHGGGMIRLASCLCF
jgi:hypothetical protein